MSKALLASVFAFAAAVPVFSLSGCGPEVPATPSFARDVQPIFNARCVRCHDEMFRGEKVIDEATGAVQTPSICHLNRYEGMGDCTTVGPTCSVGASLCANLPVAPGGSYMAPRVDPAMVNDPARMPPPPAPPLTKYESDVINKWLKNLDANGAPLP